MKQSKPKLALGVALLIPILVLLALGAFFMRQIDTVTSAHRAMETRNQATEGCLRLGSLFHRQEVLLRQAKIATGGVRSDPAGQQALTSIHTSVRIQLALLQKILRRDNQAQSLLLTLNDQYLLWTGWAQQTLAGRTYGLTPVQNSMRGVLLEETAHGTFRHLIEEQYNLANQESKALQQLEARVEVTTFLGALLTGLLLALLAFLGFLLVRQPWIERLNRQIKATEAQQSTSQTLKDSLDLITEGLLCFDRHGKLLNLNAAAIRLIDSASEEAVGRLATEVCPLLADPEHLLPEHPVLTACRAQSVEKIQGEGFLRNPDREAFPVHYSATALLAEDGKTMGVVLTLIDITERRLNKQALQASEKLAITGRLAASIIHEILNPLDAVANLQYLITVDTDPEQQAKHLAMAREELARTLLIARNMLNLYREADHPVAIDLVELTKGVLMLVEHRATQLGIGFEQHYEENCFIEGFPAELRQVISNVLVNAIDAAGAEGKIRIEVKRRVAEELNCSGVLLRVTDSGAGISPENLDRLFKPFFTTKGESGTGLGLWVSRGIVQKHGGSMRLYTSQEADLHGACVEIFIPTSFPLTPPTASESES